MGVAYLLGRGYLNWLVVETCVERSSNECIKMLFLKKATMLCEENDRSYIQLNRVRVLKRKRYHTGNRCR